MADISGGGNRGRPPNNTRGKLSMQDVARLVNQGALAPIDRFGRKIKEGDVVLWSPPKDLAFVVTEIHPVLDPRAPMHQVTLVLQMPGPAPVTTVVNIPSPTMLVVGRMIKDKDGKVELVMGTIEAKETDLISDLASGDKAVQEAAAAAAQEATTTTEMQEIMDQAAADDPDPDTHG